MNQRGWICLARSFLDHPIVGVSPDEPFTTRDAWIWLLQNAAHTPHDTKFGKEIIHLERKQLPAGRTYLAKIWRWSPQKVRNFLTQLETADMIQVCRKGGRKPNIITICNYERYQKKTDEANQHNNQHPTSIQPHIKKDNNAKEVIDSPLPPSRGEDHGDESFRAPRRVAHPKGETPNPYRARDPFGLNPENDPQVVGVGWSPEGELQVFNGTKAELLSLSGSEEQLKIDLLAAAASGKIGPSMNPYVLKTKVRGLVAERVDHRAQSDRRYNLAAANKGKPGSAPPRPKLKIDDLPPTTDPQEVARRFELFLEEAPKYQSERDRWWPRFQQSQAEKARSAGLIS
jgi:hypothetical protein